MAKKKSVNASISIQPASGKRTTFGEDDGASFEFENEGESSSSGVKDVKQDDEDENEEDSDDEAPEAVGMNAAHEAERAAAQRETAYVHSVRRTFP